MTNQAPVKATFSKASPLKVSPGRVPPGVHNFPGRARLQRAIQQTSEGAIQRACPECDAKEVLDENPGIQPKLTVGPAGDRFEQEADQTAERVMRMADPGLFKSQNSPGNHQVQAKGSPGGSVSPRVANSIKGLRGGGTPLPKSSKAFFEPRFGQDFSKVRLHTDAKAAGMADSIQAKAFTLGNDIAFAKGAYNPESKSGKQLLAHELTHTVQQGVSKTVRRNGGPIMSGMKEPPQWEIYSGRVKFKGLSQSVLDKIVVIREGDNKGLIKKVSNGVSYACDGFYYEGIEKWFKIPDHCNVTVTKEPTLKRVFYSSDCNDIIHYLASFIKEGIPKRPLWSSDALDSSKSNPFKLKAAPENQKDGKKPSEEIQEQGTDPDVSSNGFFSFYLTELMQGSRDKGFQAQFHYVGQNSRQVLLKIAYLNTRHLEKMTFELPQGETLAPRLIKQSVNSALFDLNGNGLPDLEIYLFAGQKSSGINVAVTRPNELIKQYTIPPPQRRIVPGLGFEMGTLPNGKKYYLQPWTYHLPNGPWFVDENKRLVNPGLEFQAAATLDAMMKGYLLGMGLLVGVGVGLMIGPAIISSPAFVATAARGAATIRWLFSGTRLVAGGVNAGVNLATQLLAHGKELEKYNWGSIGLDYVIGAISYSFVKTLVTKWPAPIFSKAALKLSTWTNLVKQQTVLGLYSILVGGTRAQVSNTETGSTVTAQYSEGTLQGIKSLALQSFLASPQGKSLFPSGWDDPKIVVLSKFLGVLIKFSMREAFDVIPQANPEKGKQK